MTKRTIIFNYRKAMNQARELEKVASDVKNLSNQKLAASLQELAAGWKGESAALYLDKGNSLREDMLVISKRLMDTADVIRGIAWRIYRAEMDALETAEERRY